MDYSKYQQLGNRVKGIINRFAVLAVATISISIVNIPTAVAARCSADGSGNWSCSYNSHDQSYNANNGFGVCLFPVTRHVRWQVPEGTPPAGGWPVAFLYNGTVTIGTSAQNPFVSHVTDLFGANYGTQVIHELLDDPNATGKKYAVIAAEAPTVGTSQFWDTNSVGIYASSGDYCFLPALFTAVGGGTYGSGSQYNMNKRYAYGISSGGYNSSRMAVTFNGGSQWKALGIVSASYATCSGAICSVPSLPSSHPPTKFWHGTADIIVPISTMRLYYNQLVNQGITTEKVEHSFGHQFTADDLGSTGIQNWFNRY